MDIIRVITVAATLAAALIFSGAASAQTGETQIVRGGQPASVAETREADVAVFRGTVSAAPAAAARQSAATQQIVGAGSQLWLIDRATATLTACRLVKTTQVGEHRIDCVAAGLPL